MSLSILENISKRSNTDIKSLKKAWEGIQEAKPGTRIRTAAEMLDVSEAELLATAIGDDCVRLEGNWEKFVLRLKDLGKVMSLTRSENCVLEHKGSFEEIKVFGKGKHKVGIVIGSIETRYFLQNWHVGFAVKKIKKDRLLTSFQIFDSYGDAITKIYLQRKSNINEYDLLVREFKSENQDQDQMVKSKKHEKINNNPDQTEFLTDWAKLKDTHDFYPLLQKFNLSRLQAMELAEGVYTKSFNPNLVIETLRECSQNEIPIMVFAGNSGAIQIHQDFIKKVSVLDLDDLKKESWVNIMDPSFNMHLRISSVTSAWLVKKPTKDGVVTSMELYDNSDDLVVQFFGLRKPGTPELKTWSLLAEKITQ